MSHKIILFDIDGTLLLTGGSSRKALATAFGRCFSVPAVLPEIHMHGKTDPVIFQEIADSILRRDLDERETEMLAKTYIEEFKREIADSPHFRLMPGVRELLAALHGDESVSLGLETGNLEETAWQKLRRGEIHEYFTFGGFGSDSSLRSEIVKAGIARGAASRTGESYSVTVIGDTPQDVKAAHANAARVIAVATGQCSVAELEAAGADLVLKDLTDIGAVMTFLA
jgi:phosphoglycolate phosphatase